MRCGGNSVRSTAFRTATTADRSVGSRPIRSSTRIAKAASSGIAEPIGHRLDRALPDRCDLVAQVDPIGALGFARLRQEGVELAHPPSLLCRPSTSRLASGKGE